MLAAFYGGQRYVVNKDRFIIGRGKQSSDLTIKDPNVSRQHAMVEFLNGQYYMVDMGSTNGVEYNGQRIARKAIAEGDLYPHLRPRGPLHLPLTWSSAHEPGRWSSARHLFPLAVLLSAQAVLPRGLRVAVGGRRRRARPRAAQRARTAC